MPEPVDIELAFFAYTEEDRKALAVLRPALEENADRLVDAFYQHLLSFPETQRYLRDREVVGRLLAQQRRYLISLAGPVIDEDFLANRRQIGEMHERIGLEPRWYIGAYSLYLSLLIPIVCAQTGHEPDQGQVMLNALQKLLLFDMQVAMQRYIDRRERDLQYLNQELAKSGRRLARDLEATGADLRRTTERARAAERLASIGTLVAGLAHEIGTPMGVIQGHAKLLEPAVRGDDARWRLETIQQQIGRISRIIESLLGMARPTRPKRSAVALAPLLENTIAFLKDKLARHQIVVKTSIEDVPSITGDSERLQQVFLNLLLNAVDAMPDGGEIEVSLSRNDDGEADIRIRDTGEGIAADDLEHVFNPFVTTKSAGEGHGLGLSVAHGIVTEHGGLLEVVDSDPTGTTFRILIPHHPHSSSPA